MMNYREYLERTYAAWLGKIIGIRLGAPVEGWSAEEIKRTYGKVTGYLVDYGTFASDDDSNGPLFFVRALNQNCSEDITAEDMGNNVLNWLCDERGFFWWGGVGISTEHTAYHNLKNGIHAPASGSVQVNGKTMAEQIGGQIFSDCWGYVAPNQPELAKKLASKMSSVTHDLDGIQGGIFVAVAISLAYGMKDAKEIVEKALTYCDSESSYVKLCKNVIDHFHQNPTNPTSTLNWIFENHGYNQYPGVCHILPNTAIMIWALYYGENDFDKTMTMLCEAGWDTDCTLGNVGSILGAMVGIDGIDEKWSKPINDILLSSSCMGYENMSTVSQSVRVFTELGAKLNGIEIEEELKLNPHQIDFTLPRSTGGLRIEASRYFESNLVNANGKLKVVVNNVYPDTVGTVKLKTYYGAKEIYDSRYEPSFSPTVYPGEEIKIEVSNEDKLEGLFWIYAKSGNHLIEGKKTKVDNLMKLMLSLPVGDYRVDEIGIKFESVARQMRKFFTLHHIEIIPSFNYSLNFKKMKMEDWGIDFGDNHRVEIEQFVSHHGNSYVDEAGLHLNGMITHGDTNAQIELLEIEFEKKDTASLEIGFDCEGFMERKAIEIVNNEIFYRQFSHGRQTEEKKSCESAIKSKITLKINRKRALIELVFNNTSWKFVDESVVTSKGAISLASNDLQTCIIGCKLVNSNFQ